MRLKTKLMLAAVPATAVALTGTIVIVHIQHRRRRRREISSFLTPDVRDAIQELCSLKGDEYTPDTIGSSLYQHRLETFTDRQLIGVYLLIKVAEVMHARGVSVRGASKEDLISEAIVLHKTIHGDRHELLKLLGTLTMEAAHSVMDDAFLLAKMNI